MKVLVIGSGGREHAIVWKLKQSPRVDKIYSVPGNGGISRIAQCEKIDVMDFKALSDFVKKEGINITVVGPELPLVAGIADHFEKESLKIFGPVKKAAILEGEKAWAKGFCKRNDIPTAMYVVAEEFSEAIQSAREFSFPLVVKASGLASGKGVIICNDSREVKIALQKIMIEKIFGESTRVVIEEFLFGEELTVMAFCDGQTLLPLAPTQDHKKLEDEDKGPNTGGMGAYAPPSFFNDNIYKQIEAKIFQPFMQGLKAEGIIFKGVIYFGLILTNEGPKVLEFNVRFGDPEAQVVLPLLGIDLLDLIEAVLSGSLSEYGRNSLYKPCKSACCVVAVSGGYPCNYEKGKLIEGLQDAESMPDTMVFHAGTEMKNNNIITSGGRVLGITALGNDLKDAVDKSYTALSKISFNRMFYRKDIGWRSLKRREIG